MYGFVIVLHALVCVCLVAIILMQSGRGGGLTQGFAAAESMFGAKTNVVLVKGTTVLSCLFFITCLSLAFLSSQRNESLMADVAAVADKAASQTGTTGVAEEATAPSAEAVQPPAVTESDSPENP